MLTITKEFHFSASHVLDRLPSWHPCARMHGHNYAVVIELSGRREDLTEAGFVRDYRDLDAFKQWMDETFDHRHLNEALGGGYLPVGREPGRVDLRPVDGADPRADGGQDLGDPEDLGGVPAGQGRLTAPRRGRPAPGPTDGRG